MEQNDHKGIEERREFLCLNAKQTFFIYTYMTAIESYKEQSERMKINLNAQYMEVIKRQNIRIQWEEHVRGKSHTNP